MDLNNLKREKRWSPWEEDASIVNSEPSGTDGNPTSVATETSQVAAGQSRAADPASLSEGWLGGSTGFASVTPATSTTTTNGISTTPTSTSIVSAVSESTTSTETSMILSGTVVSTTSTSTLQTAAPGAYSGGGDSVKTKLAIAIPIAIVGLLGILALLFFFIRHRKRRHVPPPYEMSGSETPGVSTAALMATTPKISVASPDPAVGNPSRLPVIDVTRSHAHDTTPGSASARPDDDPRTELGIAMAAPMDQRLGATEHDLRDFSRPVSSISRRVSNGPPSARAASVRMPFENQGIEDNDGVSIISDEHGQINNERDFDDMSSVSSFDDDHPHIEGHGRSFR